MNIGEVDGVRRGDEWPKIQSHLWLSLGEAKPIRGATDLNILRTADCSTVERRRRRDRFDVDVDEVDPVAVVAHQVDHSGARSPCRPCPYRCSGCRRAGTTAAHGDEPPGPAYPSSGSSRASAKAAGFCLVRSKRGECLSN